LVVYPVGIKTTMTIENLETVGFALSPEQALELAELLRSAAEKQLKGDIEVTAWRKTNQVNINRMTLRKRPYPAPKA